ncbi:phage major capsid protein, partial [Cribrihabitans sp. XS_ASV171]
MLDSVKIARRQSEIRQSLSELVGKDKPSEDETRQMEDMDREYRSNETRYRAALIAEDEERRKAGADLETRSEREWSDLMGQFEMRQVALALDEGRQLDGQTGEIVSELRSRGGYRGVPIPWEALEIRAGETVASGTPNPIRTAPIIERLFAGSVAARMGGQMVNVGVGEVEYPVATSSVSAGWAASETGNVAGPSAYTTVD